MDESRRNFSILQTWRVVGLSVLLLPIPLTVRLLAIYFLDLIDCTTLFASIPCDSHLYQWNDKLVDTLIYIVIIAYLCLRAPSQWNYVLVGLFLYRVIGVIRLGSTKDMKSLVYYPDIVREFSLVLAAVYDGWLPSLPLTITTLLVIIAVVKPYIEYLQHIRKWYLRRYTPHI